MGLRISPDGTKAAASRDDPKTGNRDIWLIDLVRGTSSRFTSDPAIDVNAAWSPDGRHIAFQSLRSEAWGIYEKAADGSGAEQLIAKIGLADTILDDWSPDARFLTYRQFSPQTKWDLWLLPIAGNPITRPVVHSDANEQVWRFSPNGHYFAYMSNESGTNDLYIQPFRPMTPEVTKWRVAKGVRSIICWRSDGKEILYVSRDNDVMSVEITPERVFRAASPKRLFPLRTSVPEFAERYCGLHCGRPTDFAWNAFGCWRARVSCHRKLADVQVTRNFEDA